MSTAPPSSSPRGGSIARKVSVVGGLTMAAVLLLISLLISFFLTAHERQNIVRWVGSQAQGKSEAIEAMDVTSRDLARRSFKVFKQEFEGTFLHSADTGDLLNFGQLLTENFTTVDKFSTVTGGVATIFGLKGSDFLRISTSVKKENNERAMGTTLERSSPAYEALMAGKSYTGEAMLFGKPFMSHYEPARDAAGKVVGALYIGFDLTAFRDAIEKLVLGTRFFDSGGLVVIDPTRDLANAVFVVHPTAKGRKVSDVLPDAAQRLAELGQAEAGVLRGATSLLDGKSTGRLLALQRNTGTGWWVVADVSDGEAMRSHWITLTMLWVLLGGATLLLVGVQFGLMRRWVARPLQLLNQAITTVAHGDLTKPVQSDQRDEIGELIREVEAMRQQLNQTLTGVRSAVDSITTASAEIASGNLDLSHRTEQTASNLQTTASSMGHLTEVVRHSADSARQANQLATSAAEVAARGGAVVNQVVSTMEDINASSRKISDIISVIDGIAFQTNILALNAAVEAARAGEQGRGFAVVAGEVRSLAGRSAEAAREIKALIGASVDKVEGGSRLVADAGLTMSEIVTSVQRVTDIIGEITAASGEQSEGIGSVNQAVGQLDQMTQQNAALVEESAAAAQSLREQADRLADAVQKFQLEGGHTLASAYRAAPAMAHAPSPALAAPQRPKALAARPAAPRLAAPKARSAAATASPSAARNTPKAKSATRPPAKSAAPRPPAPSAPSAHNDEWETF